MQLVEAFLLFYVWLPSLFVSLLPSLAALFLFPDLTQFDASDASRLSCQSEMMLHSQDLDNAYFQLPKGCGQQMWCAGEGHDDAFVSSHCCSFQISWSDMIQCQWCWCHYHANDSFCGQCIVLGIWRLLCCSWQVMDNKWFVAGWGLADVLWIIVIIAIIIIDGPIFLKCRSNIITVPISDIVVNAEEDTVVGWEWRQVMFNPACWHVISNHSQAHNDFSR